MELRTAASRLGRWAGLPLLLGIVAFQLASVVPWRGIDNTLDHVDALRLWTHVEMIRAGEPLYAPWPDYGPDVLWTRPYPLERQPYPPLLTPAIELTGVPSALSFVRAWCLVLVVAWWLHVVALVKLSGRSLTLAAVGWGGALLMVFPGGIVGLWQGNVEPLLWACFSWSVLSARLRGAFLAVIAAVKLWGLWPLLATARSSWRSALPVAAVLAGAAALSLGPVRLWESAVAWLEVAPWVLGQGSFRADNIGPSFAALRVAGVLGWEYGGGPLPVLARMWLSGVALTGVALGLLLARGRAAEQKVAILGTAALVSAPLVWAAYLPHLLVPAAMLLRPGRTKRQRTSVWVALAAVTVLVTWFVLVGPR